MTETGTNFNQGFDEDDFDADIMTEIGDGFVASAKQAPKQVKSSLKKLGKLYRQLGKADSAADAGLAMGRNAKKAQQAASRFATFYAIECSTNGSSTDGASGSGRGATSSRSSA
jgi:hypothetical protein